MCGRYAAPSPEEFQAFIKEWLGQDIATQYNVAPTEQPPVIHSQENRHIGRAMRWGLIPHWAQSPEDADRYSLINARAETIHEKRSYKNTFRQRRCLVPALGFFEWQEQGKGPKQPYYIKDPDDGLLFFAGIWNAWQPKEQPDAEPVYSYCIIVGNPSPAVEVLHDRMALALPTNVHGQWLDPEQTDPAELQQLLQDQHQQQLTYYPVSR